MTDANSNKCVEYLPIPHTPISPNPDAEFYDTTHIKRGKAYIFNHELFDNSQRIENLKRRYGTAKDRDRLAKILADLLFEVTCFNDLTATCVKEELCRLAKEDHSECDCVLVAVLSHGSCGKIEACDEPYEMEALWKNFTANICPSLAGKPKLFFVQACRGDQRDTGREVLYAVADGPCFTPHGGSFPSSTSFASYKIPDQADFLIAFATTPEHVSWRNSVNGAWFIEALCQVLEDHGQEKNLLWMITKVSRIVATQKETLDGWKQMPCVVSLLTRDLRFLPKTIQPLSLYNV